jgi:hypothetical protein
MEILRLIQVIISLFSILMLSSCNTGWSVGSFELSAEDSMYTFVEVVDQDSTSHFFSDHVRFNKEMWCFTHSRWEIVKRR